MQRPVTHVGIQQPSAQQQHKMLSVVVTHHRCFRQPLDIGKIRSCTIAKPTSHVNWATFNSLPSQEPAGVSSVACPVLFTPLQISTNSLHGLKFSYVLQKRLD